MPVALRFAVEADMLSLIAAAAPELAGPGAVAVFEVQSATGVPDVTAAVFDQDVIAARAGTGFVTDPAPPPPSRPPPRPRAEWAPSRPRWRQA